MLSLADLPKAKIEMYALVRDSSGKPRIDGDPRNLHQSIKDAMTAAEFQQALEDYDAQC